MSLRFRCAAALGPAALATLVLLTIASPATAHPLGNFTVNRLDVVRISADRVEVRYILDQAEIPTFQERGREPNALLAAKRAEIGRGLTLLVDGTPVRLAPRGPGRLKRLPGQGGLRTTRVEFLLTAPAVGARQVELRDSTFADRVGWRDMIVQPASGTAVRSSVPATEPTDGLRRYPTALLKVPPDRRSARFEVRPGDGTVQAPGGARAELESPADRGAGGFGALIDDAGTGEGLLIVFLLAAFGWGALHALAPGHGKSMVAAYLVGSRGSARDAVVLGGTVTVSHTIGVFALGFITLALSDYVLPEDLYPWLNLLAGVLVLGVGVYVLRSRADGHAHHHGDAHGHAHHHAHAHGHEHGHGRREEPAPAHPQGETHDHAHGPDHGDTHDRGHTHGHRPAPAGRRSVVALGASAGLVPCPSALVVLLGAISQQEVALGLILILAFSLGLATTLTVLGLAVVWSAGRVARMRPRARLGRLLAVAPTLSALVIVALGCVLVARALPTVI